MMCNLDKFFIFLHFVLLLQRLFFAKCDQGLGTDEIIMALSVADTYPESAILAAKSHNNHTQSFKEGCRKHFSKIVNLGLPRTGTLSFIQVMEQNFGLRSCHQLPNNWPEYSKEVELWKKNPYRIKARLKKALSNCIVFADIPHYALHQSFEARYPKTLFVLTTRGLDSWLDSTEVLMKLWEGKMHKSRLKFIKNFFKVNSNLGWGREEYSATWMRHTRMTLEHFGNRLLLLPLEFSNSDKMKALSDYTGCHAKKDLYPLSHVSHRSKTTNDIEQFSKKCLKYPKKCGF